ncbi:MAG: tRNA preQ1(34) S-adenosylmethionine ribosyltransferase-isomerase QueA [Desulfobacterales bacterium]|nr:tRNA preQ1(34) S-adenosylmethionine ribosyltransferase-isomerase QueA [Desulfobacterales bacterium]
MFSLDDYDYDLPEERIAQQPATQRDQSRLLVMNRRSGALSHRSFIDLDSLLAPSDVLVINNTEVIPGRLYGRKETGGRAEVLILDYAGRRLLEDTADEFECECLVKSSKPARKGSTLHFDQGLAADVLSVKNNIYTLKFRSPGNFEKLLYGIGSVPLPPYIKREENPASTREDRETYQTVYASRRGAIAAPTAGFHFTASMLKKIKAKGIKVIEITLYIGYGTFLPVRVDDIRMHRMHAERYSVSNAAAEAINQARASGSRIIAVGTTCVRTLEFLADRDGKLAGAEGSCDLFIYPGYEFKIVDAVLTNFHLPKSTLLMLISAFAGRDNILNAYREAVDRKYRFYSYGDAMFIA